MKISVLTINGKKDGDVELPPVFETEINKILIIIFFHMKSILSCISSPL